MSRKGAALMTCLGVVGRSSQSQYGVLLRKMPCADAHSFSLLEESNLTGAIGISEHAGHRPAADQEVVLLVDHGVYFFDLRAIYVRGQAKPIATTRGAPTAHTWCEVVPLKTVAWDYGTLREVKDDHICAERSGLRH